MRKLSLLLAAVIVSLGGLSSCDKGGDTATTSPGGTTAASGTRIKIGFLVKQPDQLWFQNEWKFAKEAADKDGFDLLEMGAPDASTTLADIGNLAAQGAQGFIICPPDVKLGQSILDAAAKGNMKVMSVDDQFQSPDGKPMTDVHHMGLSAKNIGIMVGTEMADEMKKRGWSQADTAACIITHDEFDTHRDRTDGEIEGLTKAGFPADKIVHSPQKDTSITGGRDAMNAALAQHPEVKNWLVSGINDESVLGGVRATENRGLSPDHVIGVGIGADSGRSDLEAPQATGFVASILTSPRKHGYDTADMMYHWIKYGTEPPMMTRTNGILETRDTIKDVVKEQGLN